MDRNNASWLRETWWLLLQYAAVGVSFIPAGVLYGCFRLLGWRSPFWVIPPLAFGFWTAHRVWNWLEARKIHRIVAIAVSVNTFLVPFNAHAPAIATAWLTIACVIQPGNLIANISSSYQPIATATTSAKTILLS